MLDIPAGKASMPALATTTYTATSQKHKDRHVKKIGHETSQESCARKWAGRAN